MRSCRDTGCLFLRHVVTIHGLCQSRSRSFARSSTTRNPRLEVNRIKSRIKYSLLCIPGTAKGDARRREERETGGWGGGAGGEGRERAGGGGVEEEDELTRGETRRSKVPCI